MRGNATPELFDYIACLFIANLPRQELNQDRIGFHFEKAYFYYLDSQGLPNLAFNRNKNDKSREPKEIVNFCNQLLRVVSCPQLPRLTGSQMAQLIEENYCKIPVTGIIVLNQQQTHSVVVQSKDNLIYGFPKGKVNQGQSYEQCAIRQVKQQIGLKLEVDQNFYIDVDQFKKINGKSITKKCRFYISRVEQSCIVQRKHNTLKQSGSRSIIHSQSEIRSITWVKLSQVGRMIDKDQLNTPSKLAYFQLMKKINRYMGFKEKKIGNPLEDFKGFDKNIGLLFLK